MTSKKTLITLASLGVSIAWMGSPLVAQAANTPTSSQFKVTAKITGDTVLDGLDENYNFYDLYIRDIESGSVEPQSLGNNIEMYTDDPDGFKLVTSTSESNTENVKDQGTFPTLNGPDGKKIPFSITGKTCGGSSDSKSINLTGTYQNNSWQLGAPVTGKAASYKACQSTMGELQINFKAAPDAIIGNYSNDNITIRIESATT